MVNDLTDEFNLHDESHITLKLSNLNYVKKRLFDPEIQYLVKKFREEFGEMKKQLNQETKSMLDAYQLKIKEDFTF